MWAVKATNGTNLGNSTYNFLLTTPSPPISLPQVIPVSVRGLVLPVLVALRDIEAGEQLTRMPSSMPKMHRRPFHVPALRSTAMAR